MSETKMIEYGVLHNRKTAGTALKDVIERQHQRTPMMKVAYFGHAMTFARFIHEYPASQAIFFVRDPISRFISGFYSRLRQGAPRYHFPWSRREAKAFRRFATPNQLAEALSSLNLYKRYCALSAMKSIGHIKHTYTDFLGPLEFLQQQASRIAFIGHQPEFDADLIHLRSLLHIDDDIIAPMDEKRAHRNPADVDKQLSEKAQHNLSKWYKEDYAIYHWCLMQRKTYRA